MSWSLWAFLGICGVTSIVMGGIVKIMQISKGNQSRDLERQLEDFIEIAEQLRKAVAQLQTRLETLEKIVTDPDLELKQELKQL